MVCKPLGLGLDCGGGMGGGWGPRISFLQGRGALGPDSQALVHRPSKALSLWTPAAQAELHHDTGCPALCVLRCLLLFQKSSSLKARDFACFIPNTPISPASCDTVTSGTAVLGPPS